MDLVVENKVKLCVPYQPEDGSRFTLTSTINLLTWNCHGLGHAIKRKKILCACKEKADIVLLQETHLCDAEHDWVGQVYFSSFKSNNRGTAILINKHVPFIFDKNISDPEGRFILITGSLYGQPITILNIYAYACFNVENDNPVQ